MKANSGNGKPDQKDSRENALCWMLENTSNDHDGSEHGDSQQNNPRHEQSRDEKKHGTQYLDHAREITKPDPKPNFRKQHDPVSTGMIRELFYAQYKEGEANGDSDKPVGQTQLAHVRSPLLDAYVAFGIPLCQGA
jgi:hypothetical protein